MKVNLGVQIGLVVAGVASLFVIFGTFKAPSTESVQHGYRGTGMDLIYHRAELAAARANNQLPSEIPAPQPSGKKAGTVYKNLKVLGDVDVAEFNRVMASFASWVAPKQGCTYCHAAGNFASDDLYTKRVARRMLQMVRHTNADWKNHVGETGVTCYTCHRGQPVPAYVWYENPGPASKMGIASAAAGDTAMLTDPFTPYLADKDEIRVVSKVALPGDDSSSIKQAEGTYSLMMHISNALGVNCTFCHNTRSFMSWDQSSKQRTTAYHGIRLVRDVNENYLAGLKKDLSGRLGPHGDVPKVNCTTCHQGAYKPLLGAQMAKTYPEFAQTNDTASAKEEPKPAATEEKKPDDQAKPADQGKPAGDNKPAEQPKPDAAPAKPDASGGGAEQPPSAPAPSEAPKQ